MLSDSDFAMLHTWNVWDVPPVVERQWSGYMARICAVLTNLLCDLEHDDWGSGSRYTIPLAALELWSERGWYLFLLAASRLRSAWSLWNRAPSTVLRTVLWPQREWYLWGGNLYIVRLVASRLELMSVSIGCIVSSWLLPQMPAMHFMYEKYYLQSLK